jgi:uncharacterized GH25 family protein
MNERRMIRIQALAAAIAVVIAVPSRGHDTWVQVSSGAVRQGEVVHVDLFLGNHGNDHRDFKIAGKLRSLEGATLAVIGPSGRRTDLVPDLVDLGTAADEGFWSGRFVAAGEGLHCVAHTRDGIRHGTRGIKSAKAYFLVAERLDAAPPGDAAVPLGHPLELVLESHPVLDCGPGREIVVRLLHHGKPLAAERVSFIPRGAKLAAGFDAAFERLTDAEGRCRYVPEAGNLLLVVARRTQPEEKAAGYDKTAYTATLVLDVPQRRRVRD